MSEKNNIIGKRIRELRQEKQMTLEELSRIFGKSRASMGHYEVGTRQPGIDEIIKFAEYFSVTSDYLLGLTDQRNCAIYKETINNHQLEISYKTDKYPAGFSHEDAMKVIEKLESIGIDAKELLK